VGDFVDIFVKSDSSIDNLHAIFTSHKGNIETNHIFCDGTNLCTFQTKIDASKTPSFTVSVHQIINRYQIYSGKTIISTHSLGSSEVSNDSFYMGIGEKIKKFHSTVKISNECFNKIFKRLYHCFNLLKILLILVKTV
jgi:hypothetical protein